MPMFGGGQIEPIMILEYQILVATTRTLSTYSWHAVNHPGKDIRGFAGNKFQALEPTAIYQILKLKKLLNFTNSIRT